MRSLERLTRLVVLLILTAAFLPTDSKFHKMLIITILRSNLYDTSVFPLLRINI